MSEETHSSLQGLFKRLKTAAGGGDKTGERPAEPAPDAPAPDSLPAVDAPQTDGGAAALGFAAGALAAAAILGMTQDDEGDVPDDASEGATPDGGGGDGGGGDSGGN